MSVWFECRLFDLGRFESLKTDLEALIRGEVRASVRAAAREGLDRLGHVFAESSEALREHLAGQLRAIADAAGNFADRRAVPSINSLLDTVLMPPPRKPVLLAEQDGNLYAELANRSRWIEDLFNGIATPWWPGDLPQPEPPDYQECQHRALLVLDRADLERLDGELARMAADPRWLKDLSWDRVMPEHAAPAFARLRDLVARALREPHLSIAVEING
jgi:hypothetical protein